MYICMFQWCFL